MPPQSILGIQVEGNMEWNHPERYIFLFLALLVLIKLLRVIRRMQLEREFDDCESFSHISVFMISNTLQLSVT